MLKYQRMKIKPFWIILVIAFCITTITYHILYSYVFVLSTTRYRLIENSKLLMNRNSSKLYVLFWTDMWEDHYWNMMNETTHEDYFKSINCPVTNCVLTHNKKLLNAPHLYDALIFHSAEPWLNPLPETRSPHQYYIMATMEAPPEVKHNLQLDANFFNLTMSYRLDSDILWNYGYVLDRKTGKIKAPDKTVEWRNPEYIEDKELHSLAMKKTRPIAWFVSHCDTHSKRENLVKEIQEFIDVDVYGKCGTLNCPKDSIFCKSMLNNTYYFYLAFENSICNDYMTEKFYKTIESNVIPVVFNGIKDMDKFAPPKSYIDANSFKTVKELATYLKYLINNPDEYISYFWWKKYYKTTYHTDQFMHCNLCKKLNEMIDLDRGQYYINISNWFYKNSCKNGKIKF